MAPLVEEEEDDNNEVMEIDEEVMHIPKKLIYDIILILVQIIKDYEPLEN